jgi:hypothetical protein
MTDEYHEQIIRANVPKAAHFKIMVCGDPTCGPHFVAFDKNDLPICDIVIGRQHVMKVCEGLIAIHDTGNLPRRKK